MNYTITQGYYDEYSDIIDLYDGIEVGTIVTQDEENRLHKVEIEAMRGPGDPPPQPPTGPKS